MIPWHTVREFGQLLEDGDLQELEYETEEYRVRLSKQISGGASAVPSGQPARQPGASAAGETTSGDDAGQYEVIESPMVGTFYRAPAPDAEPFIEVGDRVEYNTTVCIIEAMKLMNEIEAEQDGTIREILVEDAEPVSKGEPLFYVEPD